MLRNPYHKYGDRDMKVPVSLHFGEFILEKVVKYGDRVAFIDAITHETQTYRDIAQKAINLSVSLHRLGVRKGETIAICSENRLEFWPTVIGALCAGAVITTINIGYSKDELKHCMEITRPKYVFCSPYGYQVHLNPMKSLHFIKKIILFGNKRETEILYQDLVSTKINMEDFMPVDVQGQLDNVMVLYSSGTTGLPKGVQITHLNAIVSCSILKAPADMDFAIKLLTIAPWYHAMGMWGTLASLNNGATTIYISKYDERLYLETIQRYKPMAISVVPPILVALAKSQILDQYDGSSVLLIGCGAAPLDLETINEVKKRFPNVMNINQAYGMTESTLAITRDNEANPGGVKPGSVGPVVAGSVIKVADLKTGKSLGPNQRGEICLKGPTIMKGYFRKDNKEFFDSEGFLKTGDVGYYDDDGYFFIVDRIKELIKYKGYQVPPAEIEAELLKHPAVRDAGVVGAPSRSAGEVPVAFVVKQPGVEVSESEIVEFIAGKLSNPKHLRGGVRFVQEIPKNPSGKILRRELKQILKTGRSKL